MSYEPPPWWPAQRRIQFAARWLAVHTGRVLSPVCWLMLLPFKIRNRAWMQEQHLRDAAALAQEIAQ